MNRVKQEGSPAACRSLLALLPFVQNGTGGSKAAKVPDLRELRDLLFTFSAQPQPRRPDSSSCPLLFIQSKVLLASLRLEAAIAAGRETSVSTELLERHARLRGQTGFLASAGPWKRTLPRPVKPGAPAPSALGKVSGLL